MPADPPTVLPHNALCAFLARHALTRAPLGPIAPRPAPPLHSLQKPGLAPPLSAELQKACAKAVQLSGVQTVAPEHLVRAATSDPDSAAAAVLAELSLSTQARTPASPSRLVALCHHSPQSAADPNDLSLACGTCRPPQGIEEGLEATTREREETTRKKELVGVGGKAGKGPAKGSMLAKCGIDLTALAREGKLDPVTGRDVELDHAMRVLARALPCRQAPPQPL